MTDYNFAVQLIPVEVAEPGFNEYGVKTFDDGSVDVIFGAMQPGIRKGIRVTQDFLERVAENFSAPAPFMLDHSGEQLKQVGYIKEVKADEAEEMLKLRAHIPNTGNSVKTDVIADLTYEPPAITDGSVGFGSDVELARNDDGEVEFINATLREFSLTPFPAGYDEGGLISKFADLADGQEGRHSDPQTPGDEATHVDEADSGAVEAAPEGRSYANISNSTMKEIELEKPVDEMGEDDLRETLATVLEAHAEGVKTYSELESERNEYAKQVEDLVEQIGEATAYFADRATEYVNLPAETIIERFEFAEVRELAEQADQAAAFPAPSEHDDEGVGGDESKKFADREEKAPVGEPQSAIKAQAKADYERMFGPEQ